MYNSDPVKFFFYAKGGKDFYSFLMQFNHWNMEEKQQSQIIALFLLKSEYSSCTKELSLGELKNPFKYYEIRMNKHVHPSTSHVSCIYYLWLLSMYMTVYSNWIKGISF